MVVTNQPRNTIARITTVATIEEQSGEGQGKSITISAPTTGGLKRLTELVLVCVCAYCLDCKRFSSLDRLATDAVVRGGLGSQGIR